MRAIFVMLLVAACTQPGTPIRAWTLDAADAPATVAVTLPDNLRGALPRYEVDYRLRAQATVSAGAPATLAIDCFHGPLALEVDGVAVPDHGDSAVGEHRYVFVPARDRVSLVLAAHQDLTTLGGFGTAPALVDGAVDGHGAVATFNREAAIVEISLIATFVVLFGAMFVLDRRRREHGLLAVQAACALVMPLSLLGVLDRALGPDLTSFVINASGNVLVLCLLYFTHATHELGPPRRVWAWMGGALIAAHLLVLRWMRVAIVLFPAQGLFTNLLLLGVIVRYVLFVRMRERRVDALLLLAGLGFAAVGVVLEYVWLATGRSPFAGVHTVGLGVMPVAVAQAVVLARQHVARQRTLERTADELRHQVAERSRELAAALAQLSQPSGAVAAGRVIDGRYRVIDRIGAGGMGAVYEVERISDGRRLALKTMRSHIEPDLMARFAREAHIAAQIDHPNLVPVLDVGIADGILFLVMPLVDGGSLEQQRARFGDVRWARPLVRQIATGLAALHDRGIVHRDLKPANILLANGVAQIGDFGLAALYAGVAGVTTATATALAATAAAGPALTQAGDVFGTPQYMAPELADGVQDVKPSSDVFALGLVAYEMLTGKRAFAGAPMLARMSGHEVAPPALDGVDAIIGRCLELDPAKRPTAAEVATALD